MGISGKGVWAGAGTSYVNVGVVTAVQYYGDGSGLTGAGSSATKSQVITASGDETIIDLSDGNQIYLNQTVSNTTVGFASTSAAEQITIIRNTNTSGTEAWNVGLANTGAVNFDGVGDYIQLPTASFLSSATALTVSYWGYAASNGNRLIMGNKNPSNWEGIQYVNIPTLGNSQDFGEVTVSQSLRGYAASSNSIRGVYGGGTLYPGGAQASIEYVTIATKGNGVNFGDLTYSNRQEGGGCASPVRAIFAGGYQSPATNVINYVSIATEGDAVDFGDLSVARACGGASNAHGGLG